MRVQTDKYIYHNYILFNLKYVIIQVIVLVRIQLVDVATSHFLINNDKECFFLFLHNTWHRYINIDVLMLNINLKHTSTNIEHH